MLVRGSRVGVIGGSIAGWSCPGFVDTPELGRKGASTMPKSHRPYPPEFRARLVELVRKGRTPEELGRQFEPSAQAIRNWVKQAALDAGQRTDGLTTEEREEVRRLRREVRQLREEREILKNFRARRGPSHLLDEKLGARLR